MSKPIQRPRRVSELCKDLLPADFRERRSRIDQYQYFFKSLESDAVFAMVEVVNVSDDLLTLALPSSALVNYLRLHQEYLTAAIEQQFGYSPALKMIVTPDGRPEIDDGRGSLAHANPVSHRARDQIRAGADLVEGEELREALRSLAKHVKTERD